MGRYVLHVLLKRLLPLAVAAVLVYILFALIPWWHQLHPELIPLG